MELGCTRCEAVYPFDVLRFRCECGGGLELEDAPTFDPRQLEARDGGVWRYRHALPLLPGGEPVTLGEGGTPLVAGEWHGQSVHFKCEPLNPTGSFKDRGTTVLVSALSAAGVGAVVEDSSGNAGASLAAYAARAGIDATVYVPAHASPVKQAQIAVYGAQLQRVEGPRTQTARAVLQAASQGAAYASHVFHPLIHHGMKTIAFELWEQLGEAPGSVVMPAGHGTLLLGVALGFVELEAAGCVARRPRLFGVQAAACAPLAEAWARGAAEVKPAAEGETVAEGVRIAAPVRGREVLAAVRQSGGGLVAVPDEAIRAAQRELARRGLYVEPTSAVAVAGLDRLQRGLEGRVVVILTGSGFKSG
jgi:threonine synthase